jgi:hypothetical protein
VRITAVIWEGERDQRPKKRSKREHFNYPTASVTKSRGLPFLERVRHLLFLFSLVGAAACATGNDQLVEAGQSVTAGAPLVVLADAGVVRALHVAVGDQVGTYRLLAVVT